jgi:hypothetical protein
MTIESWLAAASADADRRGLSDMKGGLEALARATQVLRAADFNQHASGVSSAGGSGQPPGGSGQPAGDGRRS